MVRPKLRLRSLLVSFLFQVLKFRANTPLVVVVVSVCVSGRRRLFLLLLTSMTHAPQKHKEEMINKSCPVLHPSHNKVVVSHEQH
jgi:hypothetical protein